MTYALFCEKCKLGSFCDEKIYPFICDSCNQPERLSPEGAKEYKGTLPDVLNWCDPTTSVSDSLNQANK